MSNSEFSNQFDILFNNIMSNQAPGLDEYEKSVFLTKSQDEIVKAYFNSRLNKTQEGFDDNERRQIDFSMIIRTDYYSGGGIFNADFDNHKNSKAIEVENNVLMYINEAVDVVRGYYPNYTKILYIDSIMEDSSRITIQEGASPSSLRPKDSKLVIWYLKDKHRFVHVVNGNYYAAWGSTNKTGADVDYFTRNFVTGEYVLQNNVIYVYRDSYYISDENRISLIPIKTTEQRLTIIPINYKEYSRLMSKPYKRPTKNQAWRLIESSNGNKKSELIVGPTDVISKYSIRYIKRPRAIILADLEEVSIDGVKTIQECELDPILHEEILQRAVELAKAAYGQDINAQLALGGNSETNIGVVTPSR